MKRPIVVQGMKGLGDNIYQRAFVRTLAASRAGEVIVETPWPEVYEDLGVRFAHSGTKLRTQAKNLAAQAPTRWTPIPARVERTIRVAYGSAALREGSILRAMEASFGVVPAGWDLPTFPRMAAERPIAVIRPVTERREWFNSARNPQPEYVASIAGELMHDHHVISVADLVDGEEWLVGDPPPAHQHLHRGELGVRELLGLVQSAAVVVGGVGWIVPACIAAGTPLFVIHGGHGGHNAKDRITDPRMNLDHVRFAEPDRFCRCEQMRHACDKTNTRLAEQWAAFRRERGV